ncbi:Dabb family protein [Actinoallomurus rhizosphaericola]|uniref:Dabb family protein n=1 Tax=Actinoallomurus rhizosphaericola TaxID=2952536 RepID=UPI0020903B4F|nr:Dabb family protein [Actinoallomurus rhizosphaericola]MCO5992266.1 Dabb family protein [Actinoallomurus rhizosphaericola]
MAGFRHVVMFRWNENATDERKRDLEQRLSALPGAIPEIEAYQVGADAGLNPGNFDFAVVADFADRDAYVVYRDHPVHRAVIDEYVTPILAERAAVQYEL